MQVSPRSLVSLVLLVCACKGDGGVVGAGEETDGRLTSDVYTWDCATTGVSWMGALGFDVSLEFVPDELSSRALPAGSCSYGLSMFAVDTVTAGAAVPGLEGDPGWRTSAAEGSLEPVTEGLWYADVYRNVLSCNSVDDVILEGVELYDAGVLEGIRTPVAGDVTLVSADVAYAQGIPFGTDLDVTWEAAGWQDSFVQIRRVRGGVAYETVTCATTGEDSFALDQAIWSLLDPNLQVDSNFLYVGFQNVGQDESTEGQKIDVATRALHVVGITEI
jgi:hypothetical protein